MQNSKIYKTISQNRKAKFNYTVKDTIEAGIVLQGGEAKSIRQFGFNIEDSYAKVIKGEVYLVNTNIKPSNCNHFNVYDGRRDRKLLLSKKQILSLGGKSRGASYTLVPLSAYYKGKRGLVKILLGLCEGKKLFDKRASIKKKEWDRTKARLARQENV